MGFWYLSHRRAANAHASLRICAVSHEPSLLAYTWYGSNGLLRLNTRPLAPLDLSAQGFEESFFSHMRSVPNKHVLAHMKSPLVFILNFSYKICGLWAKQR